jgi:basic membrane protein A
LLSCKINWVPYFTNIIDSVKNGKAIARDWTGNMADGSIEVSTINERVAAKGTAKALAKAKQKLSSGKVHVFDARKFTVNGAKLESFAAAISEGDEREALKDGYFHESEYRSAPYFDLTIDGVTLLNTAY